jgi:hypothetical protein
MAPQRKLLKALQMAMQMVLQRALQRSRWLDMMVRRLMERR